MACVLGKEEMCVYVCVCVSQRPWQGIDEIEFQQEMNKLTFAQLRMVQSKWQISEVLDELVAKGPLQSCTSVRAETVFTANRRVLLEHIRCFFADRIQVS